MRLTLWGIALLLSGMIVGVVAGHLLSRAPIPTRLASEDRLQNRIDRVDLKNIPLGQAIERLNRECNANIGVNWRTLESAGIDETTAIFVQTQGLPLKRVLDLLCEEAGGTVKLGYRADDDVILLSTVEDLSRQIVTRIYDVRSLITYDNDVREHMHRLVLRDGSLFQRRAPDPNEQNDREAKVDSVLELVDVIVETIEPDTWRINGGTTGSIHEFGGRLIVVQTAEVHAHIASLLDKLERGT